MKESRKSEGRKDGGLDGRKGRRKEDGEKKYEEQEEDEEKEERVLKSNSFGSPPSRSSHSRKVCSLALFRLQGLLELVAEQNNSLQMLNQDLRLTQKGL